MKFNEDTVHITVSEEGEIVVEPSILEFWRSQGYRIESVSDVKAIPSSSRDIAHIVCKVETYAYPHGHENLDLVEDSIVIECCSCEDFKYNRAVDVSETYIKDGHIGTCRHIQEAYREIRAENDDAQDTL